VAAHIVGGNEGPFRADDYLLGEPGALEKSSISQPDGWNVPLA